MNLKKWRLLSYEYRMTQQQKALCLLNWGWGLLIIGLTLGFWLRPVQAELQALLVGVCGFGCLLGCCSYFDYQTYKNPTTEIQWETLMNLSQATQERIKPLSWEEWELLNLWFETLSADVKTKPVS